MAIDEYAARLLASTVLEGRYDYGQRYQNFEEAVCPSVSVELKGMVMGIRREFMMLGPQLAEKVTAVCQAKLGGVSIDDMIKQEVDREYARAMTTIHETAARVIKQWLESRILAAIDVHRDRVEEFALASVWKATEDLKKVER